MKKLTSVISVVLAIVMLAGCGAPAELDGEIVNFSPPVPVSIEPSANPSDSSVVSDEPTSEPSASPTLSSNPSVEPSDILTMCPVLSKHLEAAA